MIISMGRLKKLEGPSAVPLFHHKILMSFETHYKYCLMKNLHGLGGEDMK
jgi:hypothetical protein